MPCHSKSTLAVRSIKMLAWPTNVVSPTSSCTTPSTGGQVSGMMAGRDLLKSPALAKPVAMVMKAQRMTRRMFFMTVAS